MAPFPVHLGQGPSGGLKSSVFISCSTSYQILQPRPQAVAVSFLCEPSAPGANLICLQRQGIGDSPCRPRCSGRSPSATSHGLNTPSPCLFACLKPSTEPRGPEQSTTSSLPKARDEHRNHKESSLVASLVHLNPSFLRLSTEREKVGTVAILWVVFFPLLSVLKLQAERAVH